MKILTLGNGFVASHLPYEILKEKVTTDSNQVFNLLNKYKPDVIVNCIGYGGIKNIDDCESEKSKTYTANTIIPCILAAECEKLSIKMIHVSSGCINYGKSPNQTKFRPSFDLGWRETDSPYPLSFYSKTKYATDLVIGEMDNVTCLRIRMPISSMNNPRNFINKIRNYSKLIDIPNSVTMMDDLVRCVDWMIKNDKSGIYNVTNPQPLSAVDVMKEYQKYVPNHTFEVIDEDELDKLTQAKRSNCLINSDKLIKSGFSLSNSKETLEEVMAKYIKNLGN